MLTTLAISNYRSLRNLIVPLQRLNLITGPNGSGKSSVYRAWNGPFLRHASLLVDRRGPVMRTKGDDGQWITIFYQTLEVRQDIDTETAIK